MSTSRPLGLESSSYSTPPIVRCFRYLSDLGRPPRVKPTVRPVIPAPREPLGSGQQLLIQPPNRPLLSWRPPHQKLQSLIDSAILAVTGSLLVVTAIILVRGSIALHRITRELCYLTSLSTLQPAESKRT